MKKNRTKNRYSIPYPNTHTFGGGPRIVHSSDHKFTHTYTKLTLPDPMSLCLSSENFRIPKSNIGGCSATNGTSIL